MQKTDYTIADSLGIALNFKFEDVTLLDFHLLDKLSNNSSDVFDSPK